MRLRRVPDILSVLRILLAGVFAAVFFLFQDRLYISAAALVTYYFNYLSQKQRKKNDPDTVGREA